MEIFSINLLGLEGILKRVAFKDAVLFREHNPEYIFDYKLFGAALAFNLFSEYGVGKELEPLIEQLFQKGKLKHSDNIYYKEVFKLSPELSTIVREDDAHQQLKWTYNYSIKNLNTVDKISRNRLERLSSLFETEEGFTNEFMKFYKEDPEKNIILKTLKDIERKILIFNM